MEEIDLDASFEDDDEDGVIDATKEYRDVMEEADGVYTSLDEDDLDDASMLLDDEDYDDEDDMDGDSDDYPYDEEM